MFKTFLFSNFKFSNVSGKLGGFSGGFNSSTIGNYFINYADYCKQKCINYENKIDDMNKKSKANFLLVTNRQKEISEQSDWILIKNEAKKTSSIQTTFIFKEENLALEFISLVKEKCDEIDHHPSWTYEANSLTYKYTVTVNLTSHFAQNNVTEKDYELAAYLSYEYERMKVFMFKGELRKMIHLSAFVGFTLFLYSYGLSKYKNSDIRDISRF